MFESWLSVLSAAATVFTVVSLGMVARGTGILNKEADESFLKLVIRVMVPCLIFSVVTGKQDIFEDAANLWMPPVVGFLSIALGLAGGWAVSRLGKSVTGLETVEQRRTFAFCVGIYNYGYLAIPLVDMLFGSSNLAMLFLHNMGVEIAFWTIGIVVITGHFDRSSWRRVINPPSLTIFFALICNAFHLTGYFPVFLTRSIDWVGQAAIPVSMIFIGASITDELEASARGWRNGNGLKVMGWAVALRLGLIPLGMILVAWCFGPSVELRNVVSVEAAMPSAVFSIVMARHYGGHAPTAVRIVLLTSLVCLATIPIWLYVGKIILGTGG